MGYQRGPGSGLSGLIDIPGVSAKFEVRIYRWQMRMNGATKPRRGRGGGFYKSARWMMSAGTGSCTGKLRLDGWPAPNAWKGQAGTLTVQVHTGKTIAYPVRITEHGPKFDEKTEDGPDFVFAWEITGEPTYTGWGTGGAQPAATDPSKSDQIQWEGSSKTYDPSGLQDGATVLIDVWGALADTDSAETAKLIAVVTAAAAPMTNQKKRTAAYQRDAIDGGTITVTFGLTTTEEDEINAATSVLIDPQGLGSTATTAAFNATPSAPATAPYSGGSWVSRGERTKEFNDQMILHLVDYGVRSTKSDIEYPGSPTGTDVSHLKDRARITKETISSSPPSTPAAPVGQLVMTTTTRIDDGHYEHAFDYSNNTPEQDEEFAGTVTEIDPKEIEGTDRFSDVTTSSTPPADPTPSPDTLKLRKRISRRIGGTPEIWNHSWEFGVRDTEQDHTFPRIRTTDDAHDLEDDAVRSQVWNVDNAAPALPTDAPTNNVKLIDFVDLPITPKRKLRVWAYGPQDNKDKVVLPHVTNDVDASALKSMKMRAGLDGDTITDPTGYVLRSTITKDLSVGLPLANRTLTVKTYGLRTPAQDLEFEASEATWDWRTENRLRVAEVQSSALTLAALRNALVTTYGNTVTTDGIRVTQLTAAIGGTQARFLVELTTVTEEVVVEFDMRGDAERTASAKYDGTDVLVFARWLRKLGTGLYEGEIAPTRVGGVQMWFTITRRAIGGTLPIRAGLLGLGTTNDAAFLGLPKGTVTYKGPGGTAKVNSAGAGVGVSVISGKFFYDSLGQIDFADCSEGRFQNDVDNLTAYLSTKGAWQKASDLGYASDTLSPQDYSVFLT